MKNAAIVIKTANGFAVALCELEGVSLDMTQMSVATSIANEYHGPCVSHILRDLFKPAEIEPPPEAA